MRFSSRAFGMALLAVIAAVVPLAALAHEVYVLSPGEIQNGLSSAPFSELAVIGSDFSQFALWAFAGALTVFVVFAISITRGLERAFDPVLARLRPLAAPAARATVGLSFLAAAYYHAIFGPELPLQAIYGAATPLITALLVAIGLLLIFGFYARYAALGALALFLVPLYERGLYMLTYANYFGEILVLLILGAHHGALPHEAFRAACRASQHIERFLRSLASRLAPYSFALLRFCFGLALFYASFYAKILHNTLALQVASLPLGHAHALATVFGFEPHFLVLGAAIVEIVIALFFMLGIEIRFTSLFLLFWLALSLWYFGEVVWPHVILIGIPIAFIFYGYDKYSLEGRLVKRGSREPVL